MCPYSFQPTPSPSLLFPHFSKTYWRRRACWYFVGLTDWSRSRTIGLWFERLASLFEGVPETESLVLDSTLAHCSSTEEVSGRAAVVKLALFAGVEATRFLSVRLLVLAEDDKPETSQAVPHHFELMISLSVR